jgi:hypothetical protein
LYWWNLPSGESFLTRTADEAREDAIVKRIMKASGTAVLVLGCAHDLSDNVPKKVKLIVLTVKGYPL